MLDSAWDLGQEFNNRVVRYIIHKPLWSRFHYPGINLQFNQWTSVKYLNDTGTAFSNEINNIPKNRGGLYLFYIKCPIIGGLTEYPFYIGRAQLTAGQNLRKRVKEYYQHWYRNEERPKIHRMIKYWGSDLHVAFYPLNDNVDIINLEKDLINFTLFQMNDKIPDKIISDAVQAFNL
jgi:hypothetical protein